MYTVDLDRDRVVGLPLAQTESDAACAGVLPIDRFAPGDFDAATDRSEQVRLRDEVRRFALLTDILVGVGAGVAVGGVILVLIGLSEGGGGDDAAVTWAPRVGPDELGLSAVGRF